MYACDGRRWSSGRIKLSCRVWVQVQGRCLKFWCHTALFRLKGEMLRYQTVMDSVPAVMLTEAGYLIHEMMGRLGGIDLTNGGFQPVPNCCRALQA